MNKFSFLSFVLVSLVSGVAFGYDMERAVTNYAHELAECGAFFEIGSSIPNIEEDTKKQSDKNALYVINLSGQMTSKKLALARLEMAEKDMMRELDGRWENFSILLNKYLDLCQQFVEKPDIRFQYWLDKKD